MHGHSIHLFTTAKALKLKNYDQNKGVKQTAIKAELIALA